jgi:hypothetical protein
MKNYAIEIDRSKCKLITCECYKSENWIDNENVTNSILVTKQYFKNGFIKVSILMLIIILVYHITIEIIDRNKST